MKLSELSELGERMMRERRIERERLVFILHLKLRCRDESAAVRLGSGER